MDIYTDGTYSIKNPGMCGFAAVLILDAKYDGNNPIEYTTDIIFGCIKDPIYAEMRNVGSEILAVLDGIEYAIQLGIKDIDIYHDYKGLGEWADHRWKCNLRTTKEYQRLIDEYRKSIKINFHLIPGHHGILGNELADLYAVKGIEFFNNTGEEITVRHNVIIPIDK